MLEQWRIRKHQKLPLFMDLYSQIFPVLHYIVLRFTANRCRKDPDFLHIHPISCLILGMHSEMLRARVPQTCFFSPKSRQILSTVLVCNLCFLLLHTQQQLSHCLLHCFSTVSPRGTQDLLLVLHCWTSETNPLFLNLPTASRFLPNLGAFFYLLRVTTFFPRT
ncbi:unnamed protein product [Triticum turgidum subsp. durum]|uniref:Uncharacterized protein n=1 Tax=Triticum turgidum subsp. durum TaxID=4567 RepID=A0A9R0VFU9_TRITD|nr:unnamed protein product [Triticum turgidum subsp. durum]